MSNRQIWLACNPEFIHRNEEGRFIMIISTTDPITMTQITDPDEHLSVVEGHGKTAIRLCFESEDTRQLWLEIHGDQTLIPKANKA